MEEEGKARVKSHYYSHKPVTPRRREIISDVIRGVSVEFIVEPGVFSHKRVDPGTKLLLEHAEIPSEGVVLDLGCGYGAIGIVLAKLNPKLTIYMTDINKRAVELAKLNAKLNNVEKQVIILHGNLYEPVKDKTFDMIITNPPFTAGFNIVENIITEAKKHLKTGGTLQLVAKRAHNKIIELMKKTYGNVKILASKSGYKILKSTKY